MIERIVRELSDGEEMVVERVSSTIPEESGGERIEARRVALEQDDSARPRARRVDGGPAYRHGEPSRERDPAT